MSAPKLCKSCGGEILPGDKVRMKVGGILADTDSAVLFALEDETVKYIEGTLVHKVCDTPIHEEEDNDRNADRLP